MCQALAGGERRRRASPYEKLPPCPHGHRLCLTNRRWRRRARERAVHPPDVKHAGTGPRRHGVVRLDARLTECLPRLGACGERETELAFAHVPAALAAAARLLPGDPDDQVVAGPYRSDTEHAPAGLAWSRRDDISLVQRAFWGVLAFLGRPHRCHTTARRPRNDITPQYKASADRPAEGENVCGLGTDVTSASQRPRRRFPGAAGHATRHRSCSRPGVREVLGDRIPDEGRTRRKLLVERPGGDGRRDEQGDGRGRSEQPQAAEPLPR
jgi:hypothetical protein